jgi:Cd2+/Zn2+-exporting ATPase
MKRLGGESIIASKILASLKSYGRLRNMSADTETVCTHCAAEQVREDDTSNDYRYPLAIISTVSLAMGFILEYLSLDVLWIYTAFLISTITAGRWIIPRGFRGAAGLHLDMNFLMTFASIGAFAIGAPSEGALVMFLFFIAETLEDYANSRAKHEIMSLLELSPEVVTVRRNGADVKLEPIQVQIGEICIVRPGEKIALDGVVSNGNSTVNEASITGESVPASKTVGDTVYAGTVNIDGYMEFEVTKTSNDTVLSRILSYVEEARKKRAPTERFVSRFSHVYTPIVVTLSLAVAVVTFLTGIPITDSIYRGLSVLVVSCPCAFAISIPVSFVSATVGSARSGVIIKGSEFIEKMGRTKIVAFDKTGTVTYGELRFVGVCTHNDVDEEELLLLARSLEELSEHHIAQAIIEEADRRGIKPAQVDNFLMVDGQGVKGKIEDDSIVVGSRSLLERESVKVVSMEEHTCGTGTLVYVAKNGLHVGSIILSDRIRDDARAAALKLNEIGIDTVLLTGDHHEIAAEVSSQIGIQETFSDLLPQEKVDHIDRLKHIGSTMMVGDGVNDTPAMVASDVGVALGVVSTQAALEVADVALMDEKLTKISDVILKSRKTMRVVYQNVALAISVKLFTAFLAILGLIPLWFALAFGDMGLTFIVIGNAFRLLTKNDS